MGSCDVQSKISPPLYFHHPCKTLRQNNDSKLEAEVGCLPTTNTHASNIDGIRMYYLTVSSRRFRFLLAAYSPTPEDSYFCFIQWRSILLALTTTEKNRRREGKQQSKVQSIESTTSKTYRKLFFVCVWLNVTVALEPFGIHINATVVSIPFVLWSSAVLPCRPNPKVFGTILILLFLFIFFQYSIRTQYFLSVYCVLLSPMSLYLWHFRFSQYCCFFHAIFLFSTLVETFIARFVPTASSLCISLADCRRTQQQHDTKRMNFGWASCKLRFEKFIRNNDFPE